MRVHLEEFIRARKELFIYDHPRHASIGILGIEQRYLKKNDAPKEKINIASKICAQFGWELYFFLLQITPLSMFLWWFLNVSILLTKKSQKYPTFYHLSCFSERSSL